MSVTFGEAAAWSVGWNMILETLLSSSAVARGFSGYLATLVGLSSSDALLIHVPMHFGAKDDTTPNLSLDPLAALLILSLTILLSRGVKQTSIFNIAVCSINIACICFVIVVGLPLASPLTTANPFFPHGIRGTFGAASIVFFAYVGFDYLANAAEEAVRPSRDLPRSILGSLVIAAGLYILMATTLVLMVPSPSIDIHAPFSAAFLSHGMKFAGTVVSCGALAGIVTSTMTGLLSQARLFAVLGRARLLPAKLGEVNPTSGVPLTATLLTGIAAAIFAFFMDIDALAELVSVGTLYVFYTVCAGVYYRRLNSQLALNGVCEVEEEFNGHHGRSVGAVKDGTTFRIVGLTIASLGMSISYTLAAPSVIVFTFASSVLIMLGIMVVHWHHRCRKDGGGPVQVVPGSSAPIAHFEVPFFPMTPALGMIFTVHLLCSLGFIAYVRFTVWFLVGALVYILFGAPAAEHYDAGISGVAQGRGIAEERQSLKSKKSMDGAGGPHSVDNVGTRTVELIRLAPEGPEPLN